jgi:hypothetical protein
VYDEGGNRPFIASAIHRGKQTRQPQRHTVYDEGRTAVVYERLFT